MTQEILRLLSMPFVCSFCFFIAYIIYRIAITKAVKYCTIRPSLIYMGHSVQTKTLEHKAKRKMETDMDDTTQAVETATPTAPSNGTSAPAAPVANAGQADVEAAKKEAEQARLRANQLENELKKLREAEEAAKQKQMEEQEQFKALYEQEAAKRRELEEAQANAERSQHLNTETQAIFNEYPQEVVDLAKTAGLSLTDDSDAAKASLKEKLEVFNAKIGSSAPRVSANNPGASSGATTKEDLAAAMREARTKGHQVDPKYMSEYIQSMPAFQKFKETGTRGY